MLTDLRDALRQLRKAPSFTVTGLITLALGIGATTAIFTLVHQVMLKSLPVAKPAELGGSETKYAAVIGVGIPKAMTAILRCSRGRRTRIFALRPRSSRILLHCRRAMRLWECAERDPRPPWTRAMGNMYRGISSGPLACSRGSAG